MVQFSPVNITSTPKSSKHYIPANDPATLKRARLTSSRSSQKENVKSETGNGDRSGLHVSAKGKDEQALLDDLMAGLDASIFDYVPSSPAVSQRTGSQKRVSQILSSPIKSSTPEGSLLEALGVKEKRVKREVLSPSKRKGPSARASIWFKKEPESIAVESGPQTFDPRPAPPAVTIKEQVKEEADAFDDELFEFDLDLDLADFGALDTVTDTKPEIKIRYPVLHPAVPSPPAGYIATPWARCRVKAVLPGLRFVDGVLPIAEVLSQLDKEGTGPSIVNGKTAVVKLKDTGQLRILHLKDRWADLPLASGDFVNVISTQLQEATDVPIVITYKDTASFVIHHPDLMLTMTAISNAMPCPRKPLLQSLVKISGPGSKAMLYGNILHGLLQEAMSQQDFDIDSTRRRLDNDLKKEERRLEVWGAGLAVEDVRLEVGAKAGQGFETFARKWVGAKVEDEGNLHAHQGETPSLLAINGLHDIEEDIWSPKWGLKGKVDASVQALVRRAGHDEAEETVAPLEIKTGRSVGVMAHRAQTMLYTLLMEDRYGVPIPAGLLYYSQLDSVLRVEARPNEIRALIATRNELAHYLAKQRSLGTSSSPDPSAASRSEECPETDVESFLPPTIDDPRECKMCYASDTCMLFRKTIDAVPLSADDPIIELYEKKTGHLTDKDVAFFKKWETLLTVEEQDMGRFRSQLWTMTSAQRAKTGRCFGDMVIASYSNDLGKSLAKIHRHAYTFIRSPHLSTPQTSLLSGHIAKGDPVSISIEPDLICMWRGFVLDLAPLSITVGVTYVIDTKALLARTAHRGHKMDGDRVVFRIDKDEMTSGIMKMRANLASLFFESGAEKIRRLVVDFSTPRFDLSDRPTLDEIPPSFNADQRQAMEAVLTARDYALILGMPGTGKTTTIAEIIKCLVERGKSVLLTSYTHSAVDTILMKLVNAEFGILRLGNVDKVHPDVQHLTLEAMPSTSMDDLENRLMTPPVVAATCLSVDHPLFFRRKFDFCIVDEASQITLPTCIGPLRLADRFVLVGDHFQLPPIVRNAEARRGGLDVSLFRTLSEAHPAAVTDLSFQYRMNEDIMTLSNQLIYEGRLKCGSEAVAQRGLKLQKKACGEVSSTTCADGQRLPCWIQDLMDESIKAVFVDTDAVPGTDSRVGDLVQNETEAKLVFQLALALTASGLKESDLAVITPYRQQIKLLSGLFTPMPRVEILTADKSQGRDKECILISLVRSNENGSIGDLLKDWRRINVSFTRAKSKLVIFGSRKTLEGDPLLKEFLELMRGKGWIYRLPKGADTLHAMKAEDVGDDVRVKVEKGWDVKTEKGSRTPTTAKGKGKVAGMLGAKPFAKDILAELA